MAIKKSTTKLKKQRLDHKPIFAGPKEERTPTEILIEHRLIATQYVARRCCND